jgi:hypothetical protein
VQDRFALQIENMDSLSFKDMTAEELIPYQSVFVQHIQKIWEDPNQFEEMVHVLLHQHEQNKPRDIFY